ncbi:hypothetical protein NDU88_004098 [Pleurodeles waltl]|uniref:Uncharacterized protein n=1 Tax=Pleurodeles waltl TaxID=8319 RepID=A0AAV7UF52_PLEWA|nr:hypothetical protein NDU88_004098 [Pleurodeles waltl]
MMGRLQARSVQQRPTVSQPSTGPSFPPVLQYSCAVSDIHHGCVPCLQTSTQSKVVPYTAREERQFSPPSGRHAVNGQQRNACSPSGPCRVRGRPPPAAHAITSMQFPDARPQKADEVPNGATPPQKASIQVLMPPHRIPLLMCSDTGPLKRGWQQAKQDRGLWDGVILKSIRHLAWLATPHLPTAPILLSRTSRDWVMEANMASLPGTAMSWPSGAI